MNETRKQIDDDFIREAKEANWRCSHQPTTMHSHSGSCLEAAIERERRLLEILERRS